jgi:DNA-binding LacI/PurR family transcriptional regulator
MAKVDPDELLTVTQAADERGTTRQAINHLIRQGKLNPTVIAGKRFVSRREIAAYVPDKGGRPTESKKGGKK